MSGLYLHIPFCTRVCSYCDFAVLQAPQRLHGDYVDLVLRELDLRNPTLEKPQTLYWGGGTPSLLDLQSTQRLVQGLRLRGLLHPDLLEFTVECNPESTTHEWIAILRDAGVTRWSLGVQSLQDSLLKTLGRSASAFVARQALELLVQTKMPTSVDLMFDLPGQTLEQFLLDLEEVSSQVGHISFYGLNIENNTLMGQQKRKKNLPDALANYGEFYNEGVQFLAKRGVYRYEVSNFARLGEESIHNRNYWRRTPYLGVGPGAHSFSKDLRCAAPRNWSQWKKWVLAGCSLEEMDLDPLDESAHQMESLWLDLRQSQGIEAIKLEGNKSLQGFVDKGWLQYKKDRWVLDGDGWLYMDQVVAGLAAKSF